jgi:hypothetical protein
MQKLTTKEIQDLIQEDSREFHEDDATALKEEQIFQDKEGEE